MNTFNKINYNNKFNKEKYYSPSLSLPIKYKDILKEKASQYGSMTKYFIYLIEKDINKLKIEQ